MKSLSQKVGQAFLVYINKSYFLKNKYDRTKTIYKSSPQYQLWIIPQSISILVSQTISIFEVGTLTSRTIEMTYHVYTHVTYHKKRVT